ncbi:MAG: DNA methyltransferase, partial [archaeon]|nr:DNA methyltransferase [archaeon]
MKSIDEFRNKIIRGDARFVLKEIPDGSVDCILTSPPYYALRDYGEDATAIWNGDPMCEHEWILLDAHSPPLSLNKDRMWKVCTKCNATKGQLGLEPTPELYINHLMQVFAEVKRVLKKMGTCWVNIGDTYCGGGHGGNTLYKTKNGKLVK